MCLGEEEDAERVVPGQTGARESSQLPGRCWESRVPTQVV